MNDVTDHKNVHDMLKSVIDSSGDKTAFRWITETGRLEPVTMNAFHADARAVSCSLMKLGVRKGDRIAIIGYTSYRWVLSDAGTLFIGACTVGIYHSLPEQEVLYLLKHSGSCVVFAEDEEQLRKILSIKNKVPQIKKVVLFKGTYSGKGKKWVLSFEEFLSLGKAVKDAELDKKISLVGPRDLASIVYTSGTSGVPKGAMLTHDNLIVTSQLVAKSAPVLPGEDSLLFLPLAHIFARVDVYATMISRVTLTFARSIETVVEDFKIVRPHWFPSVPRVFEKIYIRIKDGVEKKGGLAVSLFNWALRAGYRRSQLLVAGKNIPRTLEWRYALATKLIFRKIHEAFGGRLRFCVSGAAPMNDAVARFFHAAGVIILEGYGMTENASFTNMGRIENFKFGSVGPVAPGIEMKIEPDGEILFKGRNIMKGYYKQPGETRLAIDKKGWLHTGDTGYTDEDGYLTISGRKKELIITSGGKNIAPARIESHLLTSRYIGQACIIGDGKNYLTVLLTLNKDTVNSLADSRNIPRTDFNDLNRNEEIRRIIESEIALVNNKLARYETIKKFTIVPEFTVDNDLLTPTMKPRKMNILKHYKKEIEAMYA